jgi:hypothetical protein
VSDPRFVFAPETRILDALEADDRVVEAFKRLGLKCVDRRDEPCPAVAVETLAEASVYHEIPLERILEELNRLGVAAKKSP